MHDDPFSFERLIHPVAPDTFVRDYWERKPLVIERGEPEYFSTLLSAADVESIVRFRQLKYTQLKIAKTETETRSNKAFYVDADSTSDTNDLFHSYSQGETVVLNFVQGYWEPAARLCSALERFFHFPAGVNVYVTPRNSQGFPPHFDSHDVFVLQVEGSKLWRIYDAVEELPCGTEDSKPIPPEQLGPPRHELRLHAGDLLYVPRGHVHEARTTDASSIHVTVGVRSYKWSDLLGELLAAESQENVELRKALPVGFTGRPDAIAQIAARLPALIDALAHADRLENAVGRLRERLIERMAPLPDAHLRTLDKIDQIDLDTLVAKRAGMLCHVSRNADEVAIAFPGNRMTGPVEIEPAFRFIADSDRDFAVRALPSILSDKSKLVLVRRAIREGLLTVRPL